MLRPLARAYHVTGRIQSTAKQLGCPVVRQQYGYGYPGEFYVPGGRILDIVLAVEMLLRNNAKYLVVNCKGDTVFIGENNFKFRPRLQFILPFNYQVYHNHYRIL